jgi:hypothetical protein
MTYRFATEREDYSAYASGNVFYNLPGHPAFPIRLASEIFQRCIEIRKAIGLHHPVKLYDPCCGGAYHLSVLAYFHWEKLAELLASDIDPEALVIAKRNLSLLNVAGLDQRVQALAEMAVAFGKASHQAALASAAVLRNKLLQLTEQRPMPTRLFQADALQPSAIEAGLDDGQKIDLVLTDIPYGLQSKWITSTSGLDEPKEPTWLLLDNLRSVLANQAVVAVASTKHQKVTHESYQQAGKFKLGKRQVIILMPR